MIDLYKRHLIADLQLIDSLVNQFSFIDSDLSNWKETYLDKESNDKWLSYYVNSAQQGGGHNILARLPLPTTDKLIDIALHSEFEDEVFAACLTLIDNEALKKEDFRMSLVDKLEKINNINRQKTVIELTGLSSRLNRREVMGKTSEQIEADTYYYKQVAERAKKLR